jgi:flagellar export protein FliJ
MSLRGKFQFPLARVLSVREIERKLAATRLGEATTRLREAELRLRAAEEARKKLERELGLIRAEARIDIPACLSVEALIEAAKSSIERCRAALEERLAERETALSAHAQSRRKVQALSKLRELRRGEHAQAARAAESKTMDEVASVRSQGRAADWAKDPALPPEPQP